MVFVKYDTWWQKLWQWSWLLQIFAWGWRSTLHGKRFRFQNRDCWRLCQRRWPFFIVTVVLLLMSMLFLLSSVFATVVIRRVSLMVVSRSPTIKYWDVGVECLLEGNGESPQEANFSVLTVAVSCVGRDLDPFICVVGCYCCCFCYIHRLSVYCWRYCWNPRPDNLLEPLTRCCSLHVPVGSSNHPRTHWEVCFNPPLFFTMGFCAFSFFGVWVVTRGT